MADTERFRTSTPIAQGRLLTVVVAAYNVEQYVATCLGSLLAQCAKHDVPVVIVVDGATDGTRAEIERAIAAASFYEVRVVEQENRGLSAARNRGLAEVRSEYVFFLDSDDYIVDGFFDEIVPILVEQRPDIVEYDAIKVDDDGKSLGVLKITPVDHGEVRRISREDFLTCFRCYAWARVVRTRIAAEHPFPVGRRFEDAATIPWYYYESGSIVSIGKPLLAYRQRAGSILASPILRDVSDLAHAVRKACWEYRSNPEAFWQVVAVRIHQVACGRILFLAPLDWKTSLDALGSAIDGVPPTRGSLRWLQVRATYLYLLLLSVKRIVIKDRSETSPQLFGRSAP